MKKIILFGIFLSMLGINQSLATTATNTTKPLAILYTANVYSHYLPCPVCGNHKNGGDRRRATMIKQFAQNNTILKIAGPYEFCGEQEDVTFLSLRSHLAAIQSLNYDLVVLTDADVRKMKEVNATIPNDWIQLSNQTQTIIKKTPLGTIAFILFPAKVSDFSKDIPVNIINQIKESVLEARKNANLIIGISSWGIHREQDFIRSNPDLLDLVLGAGNAHDADGVHYMPIVSTSSKSISFRPAEQGHSITVIKLTNLPKLGEKIIWTPRKNIGVENVQLTKDVMNDPDMDKILNKFIM